MHKWGEFTKASIEMWWNDRLRFNVPVAGFNTKVMHGIIQNEYDYIMPYELTKQQQSRRQIPMPSEFKEGAVKEVSLELLHRDFMFFTEGKYPTIYNGLNFKHACLEVGCFTRNDLKKRRVIACSDEDVYYYETKTFVDVSRRAYILPNRKG